ncbi:hypothetical protein CPB83DRAFT_802445 [Crepidotus variabilis]|uniref:Alpha/beta-hydrolase n=1 Tax=Crepidotus variabilis TaxID=179855 RepID=A0A9P6ETC7_9AGAR|nr:hypothetical protein CPB83DRAFT_802445 [Crepidotus variabilis]
MLSRRNSASQRTPRKSSSFLSLRREKEKPPPSSTANAPSAYNGPVGSADSSPYFEVYPRPKSSSTNRASKSRNLHTSPAAIASPTHDASSSSHYDPVPSHDNKTHVDEFGGYSFPSLDPQEESSSTSPSAPLGNSNYSRTRSRTGPSGRSKWETSTSAVPQLRFSNSSSTQHTETPPRTPDDFGASNDSLDLFPVSVAAPISGVEMMDALVDGMNGGDLISSHSSRHSSRQQRFGGIPGHHPLYQPPLPTPPPGVVLGGPKSRKHSKQPSLSDDSSDDEVYSAPTSRTRKRRARPASSRSNTTVTNSPKLPGSDRDSFNAPSLGRSTSKEMRRPPFRDSAEEPMLPPSIQRTVSKELQRPHTTSALEHRKSVVPSISDIIRNHTPPQSSARVRPVAGRSTSLYTPSSHGHATLHEEEPEPLPREDADFISRSSIDSVADEVQRTIRHQNSVQPRSLPPLTPASAFKNRYSTISDNASSIYSPRSDPGFAPSIYSVSAASAPSSYFPSSPLDTNFLTMAKPTPSQAVAQYLRSTRLTTLLKLTRSPHASQDNPLTVSLSDLGNPNGYPVVVFLGLGCVRHIMGLYDEMAECLGLRVITIDRWGLGRTEPRSKSAKGIIQWASAVEEVLDQLHIGQCSVMAHSAGAPYALSFANRQPSRIRGDVCLLAPWVGGSENSGYRWLKYVPNTILKTAQAAEWKIQAWMIGKPPTIAYEGIGYTAPQTAKPSNVNGSSQDCNLNAAYPTVGELGPRPSMGSSSFSEYDDLDDFDGRFESKSTLGLSRPTSSGGQSQQKDNGVFFTKRKASKGILDRLKGTGSSPSVASTQEKEKFSSSKKLKALKSMGSLKGRGKNGKSEPSSPQLPPSLRIDVGPGLENISWSSSTRSGTPEDLATATPRMFSTGSVGSGSTPRSSGRRSISFSSSKGQHSMPSSPSPSLFSGNSPVSPQQNFQAALGNALIAASHAESSKGTTNDLLQILNHENHSWGFSYAGYPHKVRVWYGDKDEKIAENAVRWMERTMGPDRCSVKVVKGADHGLMYRSSAVVDVLEWVLSAWKEDRTSFYSDLQ